MKNKQMGEGEPGAIKMEYIFVGTNENAVPIAAFRFGRNCFITVPKANS
jgi:hypothetical protein